MKYWMFLVARLIGNYLIFVTVKDWQSALQILLGLLLIVISINIEIQARLTEALDELDEEK